MQFYVALLDEYDDELWRLFEQDFRIQVYEDELLFCLEEDKLDLEKQYDLYFVDATETLFEIFLNGRLNIADLDIQFADMLKMQKFSKILFYNKFDKWMKNLETMFNRLYDWNVENWKECCDVYYGFLCLLGKIKY